MSQREAMSRFLIALPLLLIPLVAAGQSEPEMATHEAAVLSIEPTLTDVPIVVKVDQVQVTANIRKVLGIWSPDPSCGSNIPTQPIATFELKQPMPEGFTVALDRCGLLLVRENEVFSSCSNPAIDDLAGGWKPGKYEIYPIYDLPKTLDFEIEFFNSKQPAKLSDKTPRVSIGKKLEKPLLVDVVLQPSRRILRERHAGEGCRAALPSAPDLIVSIERPIPGLVIRPLRTPKPVTMRVECLDSPGRRKFCVKNEAPIGSEYSPSYQVESEMHFKKMDDGEFGISLGSADASDTFKVTLMLFDDSTAFDPLFAIVPEGELTLDQRAIPFHFPQLDVRRVRIGTYAGASLAARLFGAAPSSLFVYPKLDLDGEIARALDSANEAFPKKGEPLLILEENRDRVSALAADGLRFDIKKSHLLLAADGGPAPLAAPRPLKKDASWEMVSAMAPPSAKKVKDAYDAREDKFQSCVNRVWAPYGARLDGAIWTISTAGQQDVSIESPRARKIRNEGNAAVRKACGSEESRKTDQEATRVKLLAAIEKERLVLFDAAKPKP